MKGNFLFRHLAGVQELEDDGLPPRSAETKPPPYSCPKTEGQLKCLDIPRQERCGDCLLRTRDKR